jgi:tetratricopeptide (TPR) repeat protein
MTRSRTTFAILALAIAVGPSAASSPKAKTYPFKLTPEKAVASAERLEKVSGRKPAITDSERKLFEDARDGKLDSHSFGETCLIASGVTDGTKRAEYLKRLDEIESEARKATEAAKTPREKAERLLKFLHDGPMKGGYESKQTDLHVILDTGKFNCVSSAVLFNVIGRRLGLDLAAVEVPQHVFSLLRDGSRTIDVETTSPIGVDPRGMKTPKGSTPADRYAGQRREVGEPGLAAVIAYNHGVGMLERKQYHEAMMASLRALCLDPTSPSAAQNTRAAFVKWELELDHAGRFEEALVVLAAGLELDPKDSALVNNHKVVWHRYAQSRMKAGKVDEALDVLRRAAKAVPGEDYETQQAFLFIEPAQELSNAGKWDEALKLYGEALGKVDKKAAAKIKDARIGLFLNRSVAASEKGEFETALAILKEGTRIEPKDSRIKNNLTAVYDRWANGFIEKGDWARAIEVYEKGLAHLPGDSHLKHNLEYCKQEQAKK